MWWLHESTTVAKMRKTKHTSDGRSLSKAGDCINFLGRRWYYGAAKATFGGNWMMGIWLHITTACEFTILLKKRKATEGHTVSHAAPNPQLSGRG